MRLPDKCLFPTLNQHLHKPALHRQITLLYQNVRYDAAVLELKIPLHQVDFGQ